MNAPSSGVGLGPAEITLVIEAILALGALVLIALNIRAGGRTGTNRNATAAATCALLAALPLLAAAALTQLKLVAAPFYVAGPLAILILIVAEFFAVTALGEFKKFPRHWIRGRRRAVAVLVVPVVLALGFVAGVIAHSSGYPIFGEFISGTAGVSLVEKERNYSLDAPPPWVRTDVRRIDPAAVTALARQTPPMIATITVQPLPAGEGPFDLALTALKAQIQRSQNAEILAVEPQAENGLRGVRVESAFGGTGADRQFQIHYLVQDGRSVYQLHTRGTDTARSEITVEARKLAAGFRLLDPNPVIQPKAEKVAITFQSPKFGYSVDVTKTVWNREWTALAKEVPFAEFGVLNARSSAAFCVIPVWLGDDEVDLDLVSAALTARVGVPFQRDALLGLRTIRQGPVRGQAFGAEGQQGETKLLYRMRVLRGRGFAYLLAAYMNKAVEASPEFLDLALNCVSFEEKVGEPALTSERLRTMHSLVWNDLGTALFQARKTEAALGWFRRAFDLENTNVGALVNYAETCLELKRPADAVSLLDQHIGRFPGDQNLVARRAAALLQARDIETGLRGFATAFAGGLRDDTQFGRYLNALLTQKRFADALAALDRYAAGHDSPEFRKAREQILALSRGAVAP